MVRLGKCDDVDNRWAKKPRLAVSIADMASKLKRLLLSASVDEKTDSSGSDLLRLRHISSLAAQGRWCNNAGTRTAMDDALDGKLAGQWINQMVWETGCKYMNPGLRYRRQND
jgi:hypothetical protein